MNTCETRPCAKAGCKLIATMIMRCGETYFECCERHGIEAATEHDYSFVQRIEVAR